MTPTGRLAEARSRGGLVGDSVGAGDTGVKTALRSLGRGAPTLFSHRWTLPLRELRGSSSQALFPGPLGIKVKPRTTRLLSGTLPETGSRGSPGPLLPSAWHLPPISLSMPGDAGCVTVTAAGDPASGKQRREGGVSPSKARHCRPTTWSGPITTRTARDTWWGGAPLAVHSGTA